MPRRYTSRDLRILATEGLGAELPPPKPPRKNPEFTMQCALVSWWRVACVAYDIPEFLLWHTPNSAVYGGSEENREKMGAMLKRLGQRSGVPDMFLAVPRLRLTTKGHHGLFIELKAPKGVVSTDQTAILEGLENQGFATAVCRTFEDAQNVIREYLQ